VSITQITSYVHTACRERDLPRRVTLLLLKQDFVLFVRSHPRFALLYVGQTALINRTQNYKSSIFIKAAALIERDFKFSRYSNGQRFYEMTWKLNKGKICCFVYGSYMRVHSSWARTRSRKNGRYLIWWGGSESAKGEIVASYLCVWKTNFLCPLGIRNGERRRTMLSEINILNVISSWMDLRKKGERKWNTAQAKECI